MNKPVRPTTLRKYRDIQKRMKELYEGKRIRYDDCIKQIQKEFYLEHHKTVQNILLMDLEENKEASQQ